MFFESIQTATTMRPYEQPIERTRTNMNKLTILALLTVCSALPAQTASYTYIDQKAPYSNPLGLGFEAPFLAALSCAARSSRVATFFACCVRSAVS